MGIYNLSDLLEDNPLEKSPQFSSLWNNFEINWQDMPSTAIKKCENAEKTKALVNLIVNNIVDQLRTVKSEIPHKALKWTATKMKEK